MKKDRQLAVCRPSCVAVGLTARNIPWLIVITLSVAACSMVERVTDPKEFSGSADLQKTGMLIVSRPIHCESDVACSPRYSLRDSRFIKSTPLLGEIDEEHAQLVITVRGWRKKLTNAEMQTMGHTGSPSAIAVKSYRVHTKIKYHAFLIEQARQFIKKTYGCGLLWDKSFGWKLIDTIPYLVVRMTDTQSNATNKPYIELWYDGSSGEMMREHKSPAILDPCAQN
ncbi:MAG: hypothetical protein OEQ39_16475 [Gammaproteobacteria bacterium]|nr:hypothetical protein [Gammaproteobacteria bacterium]MDH3466542.1 hypothetical protein [Gammaproteobacteria bacterium]